MRHFYFDIVFTTIALAIAAWWGFSHGVCHADFGSDGDFTVV